MNVGFRVSDLQTPAGPSLAGRAARLPGANIAEVMHGLQPMRDGSRAWGRRAAVGHALTACVRAGGNFVFHHGIDMAAPGDVIASEGDGGLMLSHSARLGLAAPVVDDIGEVEPVIAAAEPPAAKEAAAAAIAADSRDSAPAGATLIAKDCGGSR